MEGKLEEAGLMSILLILCLQHLHNVEEKRLLRDIC